MISGFVQRNSAGALRRAHGTPFGFQAGGTPAGSTTFSEEPDHPPETLYRYIKSRYSQSFATGRIWIGTLASFADVQAHRADGAEGSHTFHSGDTILNGTPEAGVDAAALMKFGIELMPGAPLTDWHFADNTSAQECSEMYGLCFSGSKSPPTYFTEPHDIFKVVNVEELAWRISESCPRLRTFAIGKVIYRERVSNPFRGEVGSPHPFVKPPSVFAWEDETRILWNPSSPNIQPFETPEIDVRGLITKVGMVGSKMKKSWKTFRRK